VDVIPLLGQIALDLVDHVAAPAWVERASPADE